VRPPRWQKWNRGCIKALPPGHVAFAALGSEQALLAQARGDAKTALVMINRAIAIVAAALKSGGQGADYLPTMLTRRSGIELALAQLDAAAADASKAVELLKANTPGDLHTTLLGRAYYALGRAREARGDTAGARTALQAALEHFNDALGAEAPMTRDARDLLARVDGTT
jgi:tetratricopeptide (TPR) repeat protein